MKSSALIIIVALVIILLVGGFVVFRGSDNGSGSSSGTASGSGSSEDSETSEPSNLDNSDGLNTITITSSEFSPSTLTVNKGESVTFVNQGSSSSWPASDIHPTHTAYPGSSKSKCGSPEERSIFDACRGLSQGESYSFTFNEVGNWKYHDHLRPSSGGTIIVR